MNAVILDTDGGVDDVIAVAFARSVSSTPVDVTTVGGNVSAVQSAQTLAYITGCAPSVGIDPPKWTAQYRHGIDGINGHWDRRFRHVGSSPARDVLTAGLSDSKTVIVALGPLTNIALAVEDLEGQGNSVAASIVGLGGNDDAPPEVGDTNIEADPYAASQCVSLPTMRWVTMREAAELSWTAVSDWTGKDQWSWMSPYARKAGMKWGSTSHFPLYDVGVVMSALNLGRDRWKGFVDAW